MTSSKKELIRFTLPPSDFLPSVTWSPSGRFLIAVNSIQTGRKSLEFFFYRCDPNGVPDTSLRFKTVVKFRNYIENVEIISCKMKNTGNIYPGDQQGSGQQNFRYSECFCLCGIEALKTKNRQENRSALGFECDRVQQGTDRVRH